MSVSIRIPDGYNGEIKITTWIPGNGLGGQSVLVLDYVNASEIIERLRAADEYSCIEPYTSEMRSIDTQRWEKKQQKLSDLWFQCRYWRKGSPIYVCRK